MDKSRFNDGLRNSIIISELGYLLLFAPVFYLFYIYGIGNFFSIFLLLSTLIIYFYSAIRYYFMVKNERFEDYYDQFGREKENVILKKNKRNGRDKFFFAFFLF